MNAAFLLYTALLILEGLLAWWLGNQGFLLAAVACGLFVYASVRHTARPVAEGVRLLTAILLAVAGPLQYQSGLIPLLLCFIALPHFLAATQALAESSGTIPSREGPGMRSLVFTVAFYASMGLVLLLARGIDPPFSRAVTNSLAVLVLIIALPAWDLSRIPRLRPASPDKSRVSLRRLILPALLLGLTAILFLGPLPIAAELLCRLSPHWRMDPVEFKNKPPHPPATALEAKPRPDDKSTRLGMDESSVTGEHQLPPRSDLQSTEVPRFYIQPDPPALTATLMANGPGYVRSHTLNHFSDNKWTPSVTGGVWIEDAADGTGDGIVTFQSNPRTPLIPHEVFAFGADGYTLPALAGLTAIHLPRVYAIPGDILQSSATGDIRYRAVSAPVLYQALPNPTLLETATPEDRVHLATADGELGTQIKRLAGSIFGDNPLLADRVEALRDFLAKHYSYSTVMENPHQLGAMENFLFDERRGHCDFYATASALLLRQAGIPTRIAYGFASTEADPASGLITVRDRHAHAWTEIFLKNYGWTICDFTPTDNIGQPNGTPPPPPPTAKPDLQTFADAAKEVPVPKPLKAKESASFLAQLQAWLKQQSWVTPVMRQGPIALLGLAILLAVIRYFRHRTTDPAATAAKARAAYEEQPAYYEEFLRLSAAAGHPKPEGRTPLEHYRALHGAGLPVPPLRPLIVYHCATRYEDAPRDPSTEQTFSQDLKAFAEAVLTPPGNARS